MRILRRSLLSGLCAAALSQVVGCKKRAPEAAADAQGGTEIVIGHYASMTGNTAHFGQDTDAACAWPSKKRTPGRRARQKAEAGDARHSGRSAEAANAVNRLIDVEKVSAILGEVASSLSLAGGRIAQRRKIPMVSPSSTNPKVTQVGDYIFRVCFIDPFQGKVMARLRAQTPEAEQGRDPEGREERLLDRPRRRLPKGLHRRAAGTIAVEQSYSAGRHGLQRAAHRDQGSRRAKASTFPATTPRSARSRAPRSAWASRCR